MHSVNGSLLCHNYDIYCIVNCNCLHLKLVYIVRQCIKQDTSLRSRCKCVILYRYEHTQRRSDVALRSKRQCTSQQLCTISFGLLMLLTDFYQYSIKVVSITGSLLRYWSIFFFILTCRLHLINWKTITLADLTGKILQKIKSTQQIRKIMIKHYVRIENGTLFPPFLSYCFRILKKLL